MFTVFRKPKTFKLRALHRTKKFGVAGRSYQEVLRKGCFHFQVPGAGVRVPSLAGARGRGSGAFTCGCPGPGFGCLHLQVPRAGVHGTWRLLRLLPVVTQPFSGSLWRVLAQHLPLLTVKITAALA